MPAGYFAASGSGVGRVATQVIGVPLGDFEITRHRLRAPLVTGATTAAVHFFTRVSALSTPPLGWIARPGNVDPATIDQMDLASSKTGISLTQSATVASDSTVPSPRAICQGELWVIVDVTVAGGAWSVVGLVECVDLSTI